MKKLVLSLFVMAVLAAAVVSGSVSSLANGCASPDDTSAPFPCPTGVQPDEDDDNDGEG